MDNMMVKFRVGAGPLTVSLVTLLHDIFRQGQASELNSKQKNRQRQKLPIDFGLEHQTIMPRPMSHSHSQSSPVNFLEPVSLSLKLKKKKGLTYSLYNFSFYKISRCDLEASTTEWLNFCR